MIVVGVTVSGCPNATLVTIYEPQRGMRTPTVVDRKIAPLAATSVALRCLEEPTGDPLSRMFASAEARDVCSRLVKSVEGAGATANVVSAPPGETDEPFDLYVEWQVHEEHGARSPWMDAASTLTCTMLPSIEQRTYRHRAVVRGRDRSVLQTYESRARFLDYDGCGFWLVTWMLDFLRSDDEKVGGDHGRRRYSRDLYRQMTQSLVNARARSDVLRLTPPRWSVNAAARPVAPAAPTAAVPTAAVPQTPTTTTPTATPASTPTATPTATPTTTPATTTTTPTSAPTATPPATPTPAPPASGSPVDPSDGKR